MPESDQTRDNPAADARFMPQQLMMQAFQNWQQFVNQYTQEILSNRQLLDTSGKTLEGVMKLKHQTDQAMEMAVSSMQMPTKSDIELLLQRLSLLENLVRDLNDKVEQLLDREQAR